MPNLDDYRMALRVTRMAARDLSATSTWTQDQEPRAYLVLDWLIRTWTPLWLDPAGLSDQAADLRALDEIVDLATIQAAKPVVDAAVAGASAAWDTAVGAAPGDDGPNKT